jgi:hypothetical protein
VKINIVDAEDWAGLYIDGNLIYEGHSLSAEDVLHFLQIPYDQRWVDGDLEEFGNRLPKTFAELGP